MCGEVEGALAPSSVIAAVKLHRKINTAKLFDDFLIIPSPWLMVMATVGGVGRHPKTGKKKGGIKVHTNIHANEFVPSDIKFTSAATNDNFMLKPANYDNGDIIAMDRAYIDYARFEELTYRGVTYVTKMKKNLVYDTLSDTMYMSWSVESRS